MQYKRYGYTNLYKSPEKAPKLSIDYYNNQKYPRFNIASVSSLYEAGKQSLR